VSATSANGGGGKGKGLKMDAKQACTVLYSSMPALDARATEMVLRQLAGPASVEWARVEGNVAVPMLGGVARFGPHEIAMIALNAPVRKEILEQTVGVSPMPNEQRALLMSHRAAVRLLYLGGSDDPVEQLTALYHVATALITQGGIGILNERAALAQPTELLAEYLPIRSGDPPPLPLWVGVVTFNATEVEAHERYLMRTYGMEQFGRPELGIYMQDRSLADAVYHALMNVGLYIVESGAQLDIGPGHRADFNGHTYLFTEPDEEDSRFGSPTGFLLLVEV
jgi:hypothetical protein